MIALLQRVSQAAVHVNGEKVGSIGKGLLVLLAVQPGDGEAQANRMLERLLAYRVFPDSEDRMNLDLRQANGGLLLVPQFTLAADTRKGNRPSFTRAAPPELGEKLFEYIADRARATHPETGFGQFGANMQVSLVNDGPVTFWLEVPPG